MQYNDISAQQATEMLKCIPNRPDYQNWLHIISAIGNYFDYGTALNILSSHFRDEKPNELEKKLNQRLKNISIATLIFHAKQNGYRSNTTYTRTHNTSFSGKNVSLYQNQQSKPKIDLTSLKTELLFKQSDRVPVLESLPEFVREIVESDIQNGISEHESIKNNLQYAYWLKSQDRAFYVSVNERILNKNLDRETRNPKSSFYELTNYFIPKILTTNELIESISKGYAICPCELKTNNPGFAIRKNDNFLRSNLFCIDIDTGLTIESAFNIPETKKALFIYTSPSHTESAHRFRIVFGMPVIFDGTNVEILKELIKSYIKIYSGDVACSAVANVFYGNDCTTVYNLQSGEILEYFQGNLLNA